MSFRPTRTCAAPAADAASPSRVSLALSALLKTSQYPSSRATKTFSRCVGNGLYAVLCCMPLLLNKTYKTIVVMLEFVPVHTHTPDNVTSDAITLTTSIPSSCPHVPPRLAVRRRRYLSSPTLLFSRRASVVSASSTAVSPTTPLSF